MDFAVVQPAERDGELVADPAPERANLGKAQVMRVARRSPADEAGPRGYELEVRLVPVPPDFREREDALVDAAAPSPTEVIPRGRAGLAGGWVGSTSSSAGWPASEACSPF
jgi:hypothetical protein